VINVDYDLPFGVGRQFVNHPGVLDRIIGGWKSDMEWWGQTGQPFTVTISRVSGMANANGGENNTAIKVANAYANNLQPPANYNGALTSSGMTTGAASNTAANVCAAQTKTRQRWFNPCAFADPLGVVSSSNATAIADLAPYQTGTFSYYSPAVGVDNALADGAFNTSGGSSGLGPVPYVTGYAAVKPFFGSPNVQGLQDFPRAVPGGPRRRLQPLESPEPRQSWQYQHEYRRQRCGDHRDWVKPEPHHRRTLLPVVREVRVLN
jgi:hypothetical protein